MAIRRSHTTERWSPSSKHAANYERQSALPSAQCDRRNAIGLAIGAIAIGAMRSASRANLHESQGQNCGSAGRIRERPMRQGNMCSSQGKHSHARARAALLANLPIELRDVCSSNVLRPARMNACTPSFQRQTWFWAAAGESAVCSEEGRKHRPHGIQKRSDAGASERRTKTWVISHAL